MHTIADIPASVKALFKRLSSTATGPGPIYLYKPLLHLVLPSWRKPEAILASPYVHLAEGALPTTAALPPRSARFLFYFNGVLGTKSMGGGRLDNYSFGLRQQLYTLLELVHA